MLINDKEYLTETLDLERSEANFQLNMFLEANEATLYENLKQRMITWKKESTTLVQVKLREKTTKIKNKILMLRRRDYYNQDFIMKDQTKILKDPMCYAKLAKWIEKTDSYRLALSTPKDLEKGSNYKIFAQRKNDKIITTHGMISQELNSEDANKLAAALENFDFKDINSPGEFNTMIGPIIASLTAAMNEFERIIYNLNRAYVALVSSLGSIQAKFRKDGSMLRNITPGIRYQQKNDMLFNLLSAISYANKTLTNTCKGCINKMSELINYYNERFTKEED